MVFLPRTEIYSVIRALSGLLHHIKLTRGRVAQKYPHQVFVRSYYVHDIEC